MPDLKKVELIRALNIKAQREGWLKSSNVSTLYWKNVQSIAPELLSAIYQTISKHLNPFEHGDTLADRLITKTLLDRYGERMVNHNREPEAKRTEVPLSSWLLDTTTASYVEQIYKLLLEKWRQSQA